MKKSNHHVLATAIVFTFLSGGALADCKAYKESTPAHNKDTGLKCNSLSENEKKTCTKEKDKGTKNKDHTRQVLRILI